MGKKQEYYALLGIQRNASPEEIRQAYFMAARRFHPDKNLAVGETEIFLEVQEAYEVLSNLKKRERYDATLPPQPDLGHFLDQKVYFSRNSMMSLDEPQLIYVLLDFSIPPTATKRPPPPMNLCLVLDRSTSMQGRNMDVVKATALQIMHRLQPQDIFSVVAFSDRAETLISGAHGTELSKEEARIQMLNTSGGTEIFSGLNLGFNEILHNVHRSKLNHIILLTDGRTYGDEEDCLKLAQRAAERGIGISGLGVGSEWNDNFLDKLASITGGSSAYLPHPQDIQHALLDKFNQFEKTYAEETRLEFEHLEGVELRYIFRLEPEAGLLLLESPIQLGPMIWDTRLQVLIEFLVQPEAVRQERLTVFNGTVSVGLADRPNHFEPIPIRLIRPILRNAIADPPPAEIVSALSKLKFYRLQEQAHLEAAGGDYIQASEHLSRLATHLLAQGERELARTALMEAENLQKKKSFSQQGEKEIKYGTRALLKSGRIAE